MWIKRGFQPLYNADGGAGGGGGDGGNGGGGGGGQPWHQGLDAEIIGHAQNKGWSLDDPKGAFEAAAKAARAAEQHIGAPPDRLIKLPKDATDAEGWKGVYSRLGVPAEAKEYDFAGVKHADGTELAPALADALRPALLNARVPKDRGGEVATAIVKHLDGVTAAAKAEATANLEVEKKALNDSWGKNGDYNRVMAKKGAERLGLDAAAVDALEQVVGYSKTMEALRRVGQNTSEDTFVDGNGNQNKPMTTEGAKARKAELMQDAAWRQRWMNGDREAVTEMNNLDMLIAGVAA